MVLQTSPSSPAIDAIEARWASEQLSILIDHVGTDSVAGLILKQARQELVSLVRSPGAGEVIGPFRVRVAA